MAKKLIFADDRRNELVCDNPKCDYQTPPGVLTFGEHLIGLPCPKCGESLLTRQDYEGSQRMFRVVEWVNRWFGWLGHERVEDAPPGSYVQETSMRVVGGKLQIEQRDLRRGKDGGEA